MRKLLALVVLLGVAGVAGTILWCRVLSGSAPPGPPRSPDGMHFLPGYQHEVKQGIDSKVGRIWKQDGMSIHYDIGDMAGNNARGIEDVQLLWRKEQNVAGQKIDLAMTRERVLWVTVGGTANFWAEVKSDEDIADLLLMALTCGEAAPKR